MRSWRLLMFLALVAGCVLLLASAALAQDRASSAAARYVLKPAVEPSYGQATVAPPWEVRGESSGGRYRLQVVHAPPSSQAPCCCVYMSCIRNQ
jgi:hypothetical protein